MESSKKNQAVQVSNSYWIEVIAIFSVGWVLMYATRTIFNPVTGVIREQFDLSNAQFGSADSIFFLTYAVAWVPFGMIGDKIGRRLVTAVGFIVPVIPTYFSGLAIIFAMFLVIRAIVNIGQGACYGPQYTLSTEAILASRRTTGNAIINSRIAFDTSGGYLLSSKLVLENGEHWSKPFSIIAIPAFIVGILLHTILEEKVIRPDEEAARAAAGEEPREKISLKEIFSDRNLLAAFILCFTSIYANFVIITWSPQFLIAERGFTGTSVDFISSPIPWASIPGALISARLSDRTGAMKKLVFTLAPLTILSVLAIVFVTNQTLLVSVLILYGLTGKLVLDPIMMTFVTKHALRAISRTTLSIYNFTGMSRSVLVPYVTGYSADTAGSMRVGFHLSCVPLVTGLLAFTFLAKGESKSELG